MRRGIGCRGPVPVSNNREGIDMTRHSFSCAGRFFAARTAGAGTPASFESVSRL